MSPVAEATTRASLQAALAALDAQRPVLGDAVADLAMAALRAQLATLPNAPVRQRLTHATVLFADVVGSTQMGSQLDPEAMHAVLDGAMQALTKVVGGHGGRVLQYAGDSLLAVFGADRALEDDAERAVLAGLAMLTEATLHADRVRQRHGHIGFGLRVGVHSGPVLLGGGVDGDSSIRGNTVHIAARMEQTAPAGALRISQDVYRQVRGAFEVQVQPPLQVKGAAAPLTTYLVSRALPDAQRRSGRAGRGVEGRVTPLVGRAAELALLADSHDAVTQTGRCRCTVLVGEAGVGKSRLLAEFVQLVGGLGALGNDARLWLARGQSQRMQQPYGLLRELFFGRAGIHDGDSQGQAQHKLAGVLATVFAERADEHTALLGQLLGLDYTASPHVRGIAEQGQQVRDRGLHTAALWLAHEARACESPLLLWLDDLHWADEGSLDALQRMLPACADVPLLVVCASRDTRWADSASAAVAQLQQRLTLEPLAGLERAELAAALLQPLGAAVPLALRERVAEIAGGNPFFMEELTQMLIDDGVAPSVKAIVQAGVEAGPASPVSPVSPVSPASPTAAADALLPRRLPATVAGVIQARLDGLPARERRTLQCASVVGTVFWDEAVSHLHAAATHSLPALQALGLTLPHSGSSFVGTREFAFRHHLFHQATYDGVLRSDKRALHAQTAAWLDQRSAQRPGEWHAVIAAHLEQAGDNAAAAQRWGLAAESAIARGALAAALAQISRALALCAADDDRSRFPLLLARDWALHLQGDTQAGLATLETLAQTAARLGEAEGLAEAAGRRSRLLAMSGRNSDALTAAQEAIRCATTTGARTRAQADFQAAVAHVGLGGYSAALQHSQRALAHLDAAADPPANMRAAILSLIGTACLHTHQKAAAALHYQQALALYRANGDLLAESATLGMLGDLARTLGDHAQARSTLQTVLLLCQRLGNRRSQVYAHLNLSLVELNAGNLAAAQAHTQQADTLAQAVSDDWARAVALTNAGHVCLAQGDTAAAEAAYVDALARLEKLGARNTALEPLAGLAAAALAGGQPARAADCARQVEKRLADGASLDGLDEPLRLRWACHRALAAEAALGDVGEVGNTLADAVLQRAHAEMLAMAADASDPAARRTFLSQSEAHRGIASAWAARQAGG